DRPRSLIPRLPGREPDRRAAAAEPREREPSSILSPPANGELSPHGRGLIPRPGHALREPGSSVRAEPARGRRPEEVADGERPAGDQGAGRGALGPRTHRPGRR